MAAARMMPPISNMTPAAAIVNLRPAFLLRYAAGMNFFIKAHQHAMRQTKHTVLAHHANAQAEICEDWEQPHRAEHVQALHSKFSVHEQNYARVHFYAGQWPLLLIRRRNGRLHTRVDWYGALSDVACIGCS